MNEHTLRVLEYHKIKNIVAAYAASEMGREAVAALIPENNEERVEARLTETRNLIQILQSGETPPLEGIPDIRNAVKKLALAGSILSPAELLKIATVLAIGRRVKRFFHLHQGRASKGTSSAYLLYRLAERIQPLKDIEEAIFSTVDENNEVKDSASPALRKIRRYLARLRDHILERMSSILQQTGFQKVIQEPVITLRDDRYVLPLKPNFRQSLKGIVHGHSGSRATLFVEPLDIVDDNNRLAELRIEEREEIERILREISLLLSGAADTIQETIRVLAVLDSIYARARFGIDYNAVVPEISRAGEINLQSAKHPLLVGKSKASGSIVTPNDILLDSEHRVFILSGPNAGGKTVVLKTVGLLCLMAQSGLPVTAAEGSRFPCFRSVFADIGDEQSLEQDISTFSSHVSQIADILKQAGKDSLVLLDELGSGTDPGEGGRLGAAILEDLLERGCLTVVTTHHNALKLFGSRSAGAVNAAMEFDSRTLKPTYRIIPGRPGRSYGLDMAVRLGVPEKIIQKARSGLDEDDLKLEQLLRQIEEESRLLSQQRQMLDKELAGAQADREEAEAALKSAREEARALRVRANTEAKEILAALRGKLRDLSNASRGEHAEIRKARAEVDSLARRLQPNELEKESPPSGLMKKIQSGDAVRIRGLNKTGVVVTTARGIVEVEVGGKKIKTVLADLMPAQENLHPPVGTSGWTAELREEEGPADRLNIIGLRVADGLAEVDHFIGRAVLGNLSSVMIIHGLGTGALKKAVADFLKNHPLVASIRSGEPSEGGAGVTIAELKK